MRRPILLALLASAAVACDTGFDPQYLVKDLRILAIRAHVVGSDTADVCPGDSLQLDALVANPLGRTPLTIEWYACAPSDTDALPPCLDPEVLRDPARLATTPGVLLVGTGAHPDPIAIPDVTAAIDSLLAIALAEPSFQCRLYVELPVVVAATAGDRQEVAVKRVRVTPCPSTLVDTTLEGAYVVNVNPGILDVAGAPTNPDSCTGGVSLATPCDLSLPACAGGMACVPDLLSATGVCTTQLPGGLLTLCTLPSAAPQVFNQCGPEGEREQYKEGLTWQWYVTGGRFPNASSGAGNATGSTIDFERPSGAFTMWVIVRDGRGGEGWVRRDFSTL